MKYLPEIIQAALEQWIGDKQYELCHYWVQDKVSYDVYYVAVYYNHTVHFFRFWGNEKDGYDISKDATFYPEQGE